MQPKFVLANLHLGNIHLDETGSIAKIEGFNFPQAAPEAAEMYNALIQFVAPDVASLGETVDELRHGYQSEGGSFDFANPINDAIMRILELNHFLRAATVYSLRADKEGTPDLMRQAWGKVFKEDILAGILRDEGVDYRQFRDTISNKFKKK